jgi:hypothetical protein
MTESSTGASDASANSEHSAVPEQHDRADQDALPDLVEPLNSGSGRESRDLGSDDCDWAGSRGD